MELAIPRDRAGSFEPVLIAKGQKRVWRVWRWIKLGVLCQIEAVEIHNFGPGNDEVMDEFGL